MFCTHCFLHNNSHKIILTICCIALFNAKVNAVTSPMILNLIPNTLTSKSSNFKRYSLVCGR